MKYLVGNRGSGVTSDLVLEASKYNLTIVTATKRQKELYIEKAEALGVKPPKVMVIGADDSFGQKREKLIIDNLHNFIDNMLVQNHIYGDVVTIGDTVEGMV